VNLAQVCRIDYRRTDVARDEVSGFDLYMVDGTVITLYQGDAGFEKVAAELSEQGIVQAPCPAMREMNQCHSTPCPGSGSVCIFRLYGPARNAACVAPTPGATRSPIGVCRRSDGVTRASAGPPLEMRAW
jgi:hypothetical protein